MRSGVLGLLLALLAAAPAAWAQAPRLRLVAEADGRATYEVVVDWEAPLAAALAQHDGEMAAHELALAATRGYETVSAEVPLDALVPPALSVLAADYDDAPAPALADSAGALTRPVAEVVSVGLQRKRPVGTLVVRLLRVEDGRVQRVRRLRVSVATAREGAAAPPPAAYARGGSSVLAQGRWFKIPIEREGVYRLDRAYLQALGVDVNALDPAALQVYHNGGRPLPALVGAPRPDDLVENPVLVTGGEDGRFDAADALYFFAQGPLTWDWNATAERWEHTLNPFTQRTFVFLRVDGAAGRRVPTATFPAFPDAERLATLEGRAVAEDDRINLDKGGEGSGLEWFGPELTPARPSLPVLDLPLADLAGGTVRYRARAVARAIPSATITFNGSGGATASVRPPAVSNSEVQPAATAASAEFAGSVAGGDRLTVTASVTAPGDVAAWMDWVEAVYPQAPRPTDGVLRFATPGGRAGRFEVALDGFAAAPEVWDVTEPGQIRRLATSAAGGQHLVHVEVAEGAAPSELVAFTPAAPAVVAPAPGAPVANQDLRGSVGTPDYVILTPAAFAAQAAELAEYRRQRDGLAVAVVDVEQVYNEFGGGTTDMRAQRDFLAYLYARAPAGQEPRYALFMGDGHYDYRGLTASGAATNFIPTFQTPNGLDPILSYTSDDYFGLLDANEGVWAWPGDAGASAERLDLGVGRMPVRTAAEAALMVAKIRRYEDPATLGAWRSRMTFVADDQYPDELGRNNDLHVQNADVVAEHIADMEGRVNLQKIYGPAYPLTVTALGRRRPEAANDIVRALNEGTLVWNYAGHGSPEALSDERMFEIPDIERLDNLDRLSIFVTATCSFGRYDMVTRQSGAELLLLAPNGGAVALFTTLRVVYTSASTTAYNLGLNLRLSDEMVRRDDDGRPRRLGDIYVDTKRSDVGAQGNNRKFNLLGDPAMRIGLPERGVAITAVNGQPLPAEGLAFRALERATVRGEVRGADGQPDPTFEGELDLLVYDAARQVPLPPEIVQNTPGYFRVRNDRIYQGRATVRAGVFEAEFIVPQDVSYSGLPARISAYARAGAGDAFGADESVAVAETAGAPLDDRAGPQIRLFLNDSTFVDGGLAGPDPTLVIRLFDESGINTVGTGVGHELLLTVDGDAARAQDVGRFYVGDLDTYRSGTARVPLRDLAPGPHTLSLTAWDVANNASEATLTFVTTADDALVVRNAYNYPNPTTGPTRFVFEHNQAPGTPARVSLRVYTLSGRPVRTFDADEVLPAGILPAGPVQITWDGRDDDFDRLATGVYLYRLRVEVDRPDGERTVAERIERLAVIR